MALEEFRPPLPPEPGTGRQPKLKLIETEFGDGYTQATPDGLNHVRETLSLSWSGLALHEMRVMDNFFNKHGGSKPFFYEHYSYGRMIKWTCKEWDAKNDKGLWRFTAKLEQNFSHQS